jgi:hypothetical protein
MFKSLLFLVGIIALIFVGISVTKSLEKQGVKPVDTTKINLTGFVPNQKQVPKQQSELDAKINMPDGFSIDYFNNNVNGARSMTKGTNGLIYVGTRSQGKVYAVSESEVVEVATGLNNPNGVAYKDGDLYVAEISRILKFSDIDNNYRNKPDYTVVYDGYPTNGHHGWKYIAFGPDDMLYVPVGAPCNVCEEQEIYSTITKLNPNGGEPQIIASGIRNTVGFTWSNNGTMWFTDNGRDLMGDDVPPDELNVLINEGEFFGFPYVHANGIKDPAFYKDIEYTKPAAELGPHVAALGLKFAPSSWPVEYQNKVFIAEHGSWNRTNPIGYRVTMVDVNENTASNYQIFAEGWLEQDESSWGRPVDILFLNDGTMLVSDDKAGAIYKITYNE